MKKGGYVAALILLIVAFVIAGFYGFSSQRRDIEFKTTVELTASVEYLSNITETHVVIEGGANGGVITGDLPKDLHGETLALGTYDPKKHALFWTANFEPTAAHITWTPWIDGGHMHVEGRRRNTGKIYAVLMPAKLAKIPDQIEVLEINKPVKP